MQMIYYQSVLVDDNKNSVLLCFPLPRKMRGSEAEEEVRVPPVVVREDGEVAAGGCDLMRQGLGGQRMVEAMAGRIAR